MKRKIRDLFLKFPPYRYFYYASFRFYCDYISDSVMISFPKSGHTWLRVMVAKAIQLKYGVKEINLDLVRMAKGRPEIPKIAINHDISPTFKINIDWKRMKLLGAYGNFSEIKIRNVLKKKKIIFLVRDPRDIVVSLFFHLTKRNDFYAGRDISKFIRKKYSLGKIINYMNVWNQEMLRRPDDFVCVRYEDFHKDTAKELKKVLDFVGIEVSAEIIRQAVEFGSIRNMKSMEKKDILGDYRLRAKDSKDLESNKVRKAKVGGHKEYLSKEDIAYLDDKIKSNLVLSFGY